MKICPKFKILNPPTNRCVNINGKIGKKIINKDYNIKISNDGNNSCYLDSLVVALFHFKNRVVYNTFFKNKLISNYASKIQEELFKIYKYINKNENMETNKCYLLRRYLDKYYNELINDNSNNQIFFNNSDDNWLTKQVDVFELITFFDKIFDFKHCIKIKEGSRSYYKNMILDISQYYLMKNKSLDISTLIPYRIENYELDYKNYYRDKKGKLIKTYEKTYEIKKTNGILIIEIYRNDGREGKLNTKIIYPNTITIKGDKKELKLRSLILHKGSTINSGHYTTILKRDDKTYEYDDILSSENKLREIDEEYEEKMRKNVVVLIYSR